MKLKLKLNKKNELLDATNEFHAEVLKGSHLLHDCINDLIDKKLNKEKLEGVLQCEHNADIAKEKYINILYSNKRTLPFLVEDRYRLIKYLDIISDKSEDLARCLNVYPLSLYDDIKDDLKELNNIYKETVDILIEMIRLMETDFKSAYQISFNIESLKRRGRESKFKILGIIYQKSEEKSMRVYLTSKICIKLFDIVVRAEEISDFLRSLIVKYPSK
ncbi:MAG: DUF47 family protein [Promethearchaeota archaeon]